MAGKAEKGRKFQYLKALSGSGLTSPQFHLLVTVLNYADGGTLRKAHPGVQNLMDDTGMGRSTVYRLLGELVDGGWLTVVEKGHTGWATEYECTMPAAESQIWDSEVPEVGQGSPESGTPSDHVHQITTPDPSSAPRATSSEDEDAPAARTPISDQGALGVLYDLTRHMLRAETQDEYDRRVETMTTYVEDHFICETPPGHLYWNTGWDDDLRRKIGKLGVQRAIPAWCRAFVNHAQAGITYAA